MSLSEDNHEGLTTQGRAPLDPSIRLGGLAQGERPHSPWGGVPARRGVRLQEGWLPASAGMTDGEGEGVGGACCNYNYVVY